MIYVSLGTHMNILGGPLPTCTCVYWHTDKSGVADPQFLDGCQNSSSVMTHTLVLCYHSLTVPAAHSGQLRLYMYPHVQCMYSSLESTSLSLTTQMLPQPVMITKRKSCLRIKQCLTELCHCLENLKTVMPLVIPISVG